VRNIFYILLLLFLAFSAFGQENEKPTVMWELGSGYGFGINMDSLAPLEIRMTIPFKNFGVIIAGGVDFANNIGGHGFIGGTYFIINNGKMRVPASFGFNVSGNKRNIYLGVGGLVSYHYILTNNIYMGINVEMDYNFNNRYTEIITNGSGITTNSVDGSGNPITAFSSPDTEITNHYGSYINIKPSICIGIQFK
jgi:hypothetical protein